MTHEQKHAQRGVQHDAQGQRPRWHVARRAATAGLALLAIGTVASNLRAISPATQSWPVELYRETRPTKSTPPEWTWGSIEPSRELKWHSCYNSTFDCARLDVPMDWQDPNDDDEPLRVVLAVIRLRATDPSAPDYLGPVIFNPGGPGGSGVFAMRDRGAHLQTVIGRNHDLITFDPRGVGASTPRIECWGSPAAQMSRLWELQDVGVVNAHPGSVYDVFARATAFSQQCERHMVDKGPDDPQGNILHHIATASHARDMLAILDKLGEEKLKYWGFSYGTLLGGVFASMYPDRVGRLVSDGNVDYEEWHHQTYVNFLRDTDKVMEAFYEFCHMAGPLTCAFYEDTPDAIEKRLDELLEHIRTHPVIVLLTEDDVLSRGGGPVMPEIITWSDVRRLISRALYQPISMFQTFATILAAFEKGDGRPFLEFARGDQSTLPICSIDMPDDEDGGGEGAFPAIMCADYPPMNDTVEEFAEFAEGLREISKSAGDVNTLFRLACVGRTVRSKWRYDGPFAGNTSFPILYVANIADNVSPLVSATNNSRGFPGSVVLVQNSYGHTSLSAPSTCTAKHIYNYFQHGDLPEPGTTCEPDYFPFQDGTPEAADDEIGVALHALSSADWGSARRLRLL